MVERIDPGYSACSYSCYKFILHQHLVELLDVFAVGFGIIGTPVALLGENVERLYPDSVDILGSELF